MEESPPNIGRNIRHNSGHKSSAHISTDTLVDFVKERAILYRQKELAAITGLSLKQVQNLRMGLSGISGKSLSNWCQNDPWFGARYAEFVGIIRPGEAAMSEAITRVVNAHARRDAP